jgi:mono/diheme cytochrome c family protein
MTACPHLVLAVAAAALGLAACEGCHSPGAPVHGTLSAALEVGPPTVRLYLVTDLAGALEPCGCTQDQLGGLGHFGAWVKGERARVPATRLASAGPLFFMNDKVDRERADQDGIKAETIARVLRGLDFAAFAPGANDWVAGEEGLAKLATASGAAGILGDAAPSPPFAQQMVSDVGGVKVGFVGFGQSRKMASSAEVEQAVERGVEAAKQKGANVLVALVAVGRGEAKRIADAVPELTAVVVGAAKATGDGNTSAPQAERVGDVLVVQAANHLQNVAVLDLYVRERLAPGHLVKFADATGLELALKREDLGRRIDELHVKIASWERDPSVAPSDVNARKRELAGLESERDALDAKPPPAQGSFFRYSLKEVRESLGKDPAIEADMLAYYKVVDDHNRALFADRLPPPLAPGQASYVGADACAECHAPARSVWSATAHARAYSTLSSQYKEYNLECVGCHTTGYERPGGATVTHVEKLRDVQCEVCHGPGSKHASSPEDATTIVAKPPPSVCLECHHSPHVEGFDPAAKMKEILGPGHGMPLKK